jgi:SAM-dependent methyltransferase
VLPSPLDRWRDPALIAHLARIRAPWDPLVRRVVSAALAKFLPSPAESVVEIGAGGGQLRDWLPPALAAVTTHTEPSEPFVAALRARHPAATVIRAEAGALPFASGSVGAVLGLCVLDTLPDLAAVRDELRRTLRPGGVVIHFLDLATSPDCLFPELIAGGELPLTNFVRDAALTDGLSGAQKSLLPAADESDEVLAVKWDAFRSFVGLLEQAGHPLAADLGPYAGIHRPGALDPDRLANGFMAASADPARLRALNRALLSLTLSARQLGRAWPLRAISTRAHIRARLSTAFGPAHGFAVEFAGPVAAGAITPTDDTLPPDARYVIRHAGRTVNRTEPPAAPPVTPVEQLEGAAAPAPRRPAAGEWVRETTVEVFAARRAG